VRRDRDEGLEVPAGPRPTLLTYLDAMPGRRILEGRFLAV